MLKRNKAIVTGASRGIGFAIAKEPAKNGITIYGIAPGPVATKMNDWHEGDSMENTGIPSGRFSTIEDITSIAISFE